MSAPLKRRISYYLSLPVVVAVVFLLVAKLVAMQRAEIIAELSDRVANDETEDASIAVQQLGEMPRPPIDVLVDAATSTDSKVAREARHAIGRLLSRAEQQLDAGRRGKTVSRQLTELARELADHRHSFSAADQNWLIRTTQQVLRLANQVPSKHAPVVAANCDLILTSNPKAAAAGTSASIKPNVAANENHLRSHPPMAPENALHNSPAELGEAGDEMPADSIFAPWQADWSRAVFRSLPRHNDDRPGNSLPSRPTSATPDELPDNIEMLGRPITNLDTRAILQKWHDTNGKGLTSHEKECLKQRGFDPLREPLVHKLFATPHDRLQLVDDVLKEPGINARPWLMLLSADVDADVRLAAVTVMATSNDVTLIEQAWQAAIHDRDPRIAALASRLRERRDSILRR